MRNLTWPLTIVTAFLSGAIATEDLESKSRRAHRTSTLTQATQSNVFIDSNGESSCVEHSDAKLEAQMSMGRQLLEQ